MNKRIVIVGNGTLSKKCLTVIQQQDYVIGVDKAAYWLIREGRRPDIAIGDFDSVTRQELVQIKKYFPFVRRFPKHKDQTDMELAIRYAIGKRPTEVLVFGGAGSRLDHTMATWYLLDLLWEAHIPHILVDEKNRVRLVGRGRTILDSGGEYKYISILPYTKTVTLALSGFRYNAPKTTVMRGTTRGISNEIAGRQAEITIFSGKAWIVESND
jgi:thiamine pyrophosphokinase